jgi:FkbM family methyltransferase
VKRLLKSLAWKLIPYAGLQLTTPGGLRLPICDQGGWGCLEEVFVAGVYEPFFRHLAGVKGWVDLGCNVGFFSLGLLDYIVRQRPSAPRPRALLGDANEHCLTLARRALDLNGLREAWDCRHVVVGPPGTIVMFSQFKFSVHSSIFSRQRGEKTFRYPTTDLTSLLTGPGDAFDLVKLDVEGAERFVFEHHSELLRRFRFGLCEWHAPHFDGAALRDWLTGHDLELCEMRSQFAEGYDRTRGHTWNSPVGMALWHNPSSPSFPG